MRPARMWVAAAAKAATPEMPMLAPAPAAGEEAASRTAGRRMLPSTSPTRPPASATAKHHDVSATSSSGSTGRQSGGGTGRRVNKLRIILTMLPRAMTRPLVLAAACAALVLAAAGCANRVSHTQDRLAVVATTTQVADLVRHVGGERVSVDTLLRPNADPHDFEPRPSDARALADAELVVRSGGEVDEWLDDLIDNAGTGAHVEDLIDVVNTRKGEGGDTDPHWWQDPENAILAVRAIRPALADADPAGQEAYARNASAYERRLRSLDQGIVRCVDMVPKDRRKIVTTHDALGYFADRYGLEVVGAVIPSLSTQAQPSARDVQELVDQIRHEDVAA